MRSTTSSVEQSLHDLTEGLLRPERYSRKTFFYRYEPLMLTSMLAAAAIVGGMFLSTSRLPGARSNGSARARSSI